MFSAGRSALSAPRAARQTLVLLLVVLGGAPAAAGPPQAGHAGHAGPAGRPVSTAAVAMASPFVLPTVPPAVVLTPFRAPVNRSGRGHRGVDLAAAVGSMVRSAGAGVVTHAGPVAGRGTVTVQHDGGLRTTYEPVTATVHTGQAVAAGQPIGTLQAGHASCAPVGCLHWGARLPDDTYLDPMGLIRGLQVRLLPWDQARG